MGTQLLRRNDKVYLTAACEIVEPSADEIAEYGFAQSVKQSAPNENILWLKGEYVQGGTPNKNLQEWSDDELSIKSLTPRLMPITLMHDYRRSVGVIADARLVRDEENAEASSKIETVLAIWAHREPEAAEEIRRNHAAGTLMQSMECDAPQFECAQCEQVFTKPIADSDLCSHIRNREAARRLLNVTFTGTGLIFGSRGAQGANPNAFLEEVSREVASWSDSKTGRSKRFRKVTMIEIEQSKYDELMARPSKEDLADASKETASLTEKVGELEAANEKLEIEAQKKDDELSKATEAIEKAEADKAADELAKSRLAELAKDLTDKLPEKTTQRLAEQARTLSDEDWDGRIEELSELVQVDRTDGQKSGDEFSEEAMSLFNNNGKQDSVHVADFASAFDKALKPKG